jgi:hypothetical protein
MAARNATMEVLGRPAERRAAGTLVGTVEARRLLRTTV